VRGGAPRLLRVARDADEPRLIWVQRDLVAHRSTVRPSGDTDRDEVRDPAVARASPRPRDDESSHLSGACTSRTSNVEPDRLGAPHLAGSASRRPGGEPMTGTRLA
jgi:hypothetical protein